MKEIQNDDDWMSELNGCFFLSNNITNSCEILAKCISMHYNICPDNIQSATKINM